MLSKATLIKNKSHTHRATWTLDVTYYSKRIPDNWSVGNLVMSKDCQGGITNTYKTKC
jgi:hypothetical protein